MGLVVNHTIEDAVNESEIGAELISGLGSIFYSIESYRKDENKLGRYESFYCKPTKNTGAALLLDDREILVLYCLYNDVQPRIIKYVKSVIDNSSSRLSPNTVVIIHRDSQGNNKLRKWGREQGIVVIPLYRSHVDGIGSSIEVKKRFAWDLFSSNPFDVTGPVTSDEDFFGRRSEALELMRQLEKGRIRSLFGMRKVGKTSLINRCIELLKSQTNVSILFIDCSKENFYSLNADQALSAVAGLIYRLLDRKTKYVSNSFEEELPKENINEVFKVLSDSCIALTMVFDEIDYITPYSPTNETWKYEFNKFWRTMRVYIQESQRADIAISLLIGGVSSKWFKEETIEGIENSVLHFVPDEYLSSFPRQASIAMIKSLGTRAGIQFTEETASILANECADFPFWIRKAGSFIHKHISVDSRPYQLSKQEIIEIVDSFIIQEGIETVSIAISNISKVFPQIFNALIRFISGEEINIIERGQLEKYGIIRVINGKHEASCKLINEAAKIIDNQKKTTIENSTKTTSEKQNIILDNNEWAEEIAIASRRRNLIEKELRSFIRYGLMFQGEKSSTWNTRVLSALPENRRQALSLVIVDELMEKLNLLELIQIINKYWDTFQKYFGDKNIFALNSTTINDRPDCHAKDRDFIDFAIYRKSLDYFEEALRR